MGLYAPGLDNDRDGKKQRRYALAISGGVCEVCGRPLRDGQPQGAHRIGNTKANRAECIKLFKKIYTREGLKYEGTK